MINDGSDYCSPPFSAGFSYDVFSFFFIFDVEKEEGRNVSIELVNVDQLNDFILLMP
jgi:hypothetical protein